MKTLHLIRHAKSSWGHPGLDDHERPLNERGIRACAAMARPIFDSGCGFGHVYCSTARRAQSTIEGIAAALPHHPFTWDLDETLYTFSSRDLLAWVRRLPEDLQEVVIVGHNPALTDFCNAMAHAGIPNLPTCGYVRLQFKVTDWRSIGPGTGETRVLLTPKGFEMDP